jgi:hypothetical protein
MIAHEFANVSKSDKFYLDPLTGKKHIQLETLREPYEEGYHIQFSDIRSRTEQGEFLQNRYDYEKSMASEAAQVNNITNIWNTFKTLIMLYGSRIVDCPIWGLLAWYLDQFDSEPFVQKPRGDVQLNHDDWLVTHRLKTIMGCLRWYCELKELGDQDPLDYVELCYLFFYKPFERALWVKDNSEIYNQIKGADCLGDAIEFEDDFLSVNRKIPILPGSNDDVIYHLLKDEFEDEMSELSKGCPRIVKVLRSHVRGTINIETIAQISRLSFIEAPTGFMRTHLNYSVEASFDGAAKLERPEGELPMKMQLYSVTRSVFEQIRVPSAQEYQRQIMGALTTKSAGLPEDMRVDITMVFDGRKITVSANDKTLNFFGPRRNGMGGFTLFDDSDDNLISSTIDRPGRNATRSVVSRKIRPVNMVQPADFAIGYSFIPQMKKAYSERTNVAIDGHLEPTTTLSDTTGSVLTDHRYWHKTTTGNTKYWNFGVDFSAYDTTQGPKVWQVQRAGALDGIRYKDGVHDPISNGGRSLFQLVDLYYTRKQQMWWQLPVAPKTPSEKTSFTLKVSNWQQSGAPDTTLGNNLTNEAVLQFMFDRMGEEGIFNYFDRDCYKIQGDDQIFKMAERPAFNDLSMDGKVALVKKIGEVIEAAAGVNGMKANASKINKGKCRFEFLKKSGLFGYLNPRVAQIQLEDAEKNANADSPIEKMQGRLGLLREYIFRGGSTIYSCLRALIEWNFVRSVRAPGGVVIEIPYIALFASISDGGVGMVPWSITEPNASTVIENTIYPDAVQFMADLYRWSHIHRTVKAESIEPEIDFEQFDETIMHIKRNEDSSIVQTSMAASERLKILGYEDRSTYTRRHRRMVEGVIKENPAFRRIRVSQKVADFRVRAEAWNDTSDVPAPMMPRLWEWYFGEELDDIIVDFVPLDVHLRRWLRQIGSSTAGGARAASLQRVLGKVLNDPDFPSQVPGNTAEAIAKTLLENGLTTKEAISDLLLSRGGKPEAVDAAATALSNDLTGLLFMSQSTAISTISDGIVNKSRSNMERIVDYSGVPGLMEAGLLVGFSICKSQPIWHRRRRVHIRPTPLLEANLSLARHAYASFALNTLAAKSLS